MAYLTVKEAAARGRCSESFLAKKRVTGGGPPFTKRTGRVLYFQDKFDKWLADGEQRSTSDRPRDRRKRRGTQPARRSPAAADRGNVTTQSGRG